MQKMIWKILLAEICDTKGCRPQMGLRAIYTEITQALRVKIEI